MFCRAYRYGSPEIIAAAQALLQLRSKMKLIPTRASGAPKKPNRSCAENRWPNFWRPPQSLASLRRGAKNLFFPVQKRFD